MHPAFLSFENVRPCNFGKKLQKSQKSQTSRPGIVLLGIYGGQGSDSCVVCLVFRPMYSGVGNYTFSVLYALRRVCYILHTLFYSVLLTHGRFKTLVNTHGNFVNSSSFLGMFLCFLVQRGHHRGAWKYALVRTPLNRAAGCFRRKFCVRGRVFIGQAGLFNQSRPKTPPSVRHVICFTTLIYLTRKQQCRRSLSRRFPQS